MPYEGKIWGLRIDAVDAPRSNLVDGKWRWIHVSNVMDQFYQIPYQEVSIDYLGLGHPEHYRVLNPPEFFNLLRAMLKAGLAKLDDEYDYPSKEILRIAEEFDAEGFKNEWRMGPVKGAAKGDVAYLEFS